jgi:hypothetical protein
MALCARMGERREREDAQPPERDAPPLRSLRHQLTLWQVRFAALLGVSPESYRTWDAGRRPVPPTVLAKAEQFARASSGGAWAQLFGIHVRTLRQAAHDGRLDVTYGSHVFFGHAVPLASCVAVQRFQERYYRQTTRWNRPTLHSHVRRACAGGGQVWGRRDVGWPRGPQDGGDARRALRRVRRGLEARMPNKECPPPSLCLRACFRALRISVPAQSGLS